MAHLSQSYRVVPEDENVTKSGLASDSPRSSQDDLEIWRKDQCSAQAVVQHRRRVHDIALAIICTLVVTTIFQWTYHCTTYSPQRAFDNAIASLYSEEARLTPKYHCGNSSTEAKELGCVFDLSLVGYVPVPCFDADLNQRFMDWGWRFFEDQNGTREVSLERIAESAGTREPFWAQHGYHITHCELAWERMHRALRGGKRLTTHLLNLEHTRHCGMMHELRDDFYSLNSQILPVLNTC